MVASQSFAKNLGLYSERIGGFHIVCNSKKEAEAVHSQVLLTVRALYSNPPAHGAHIVDRILNNPEMYAEWVQELKGMSHRIIAMRTALKSEFLSLGTPGNWDHITSQIGMFSFTGLSVPQCQELKKNHHIYLLDNGRISMAGLNTKNIKYFASCVDNVVRNIK
jgi:aspartate aminotransferase